MLLRVLGDHLSWPELARVLELPCPGPALPARTACPGCGGRLNVYQDSITRSFWHHCKDCRFAGDPIALAALAWGLPARVAARRLVRLIAEESPEMDQEIAEHLDEVTDRHARMHELWALARAYIATTTSPELTRLRARLRVQTDLNPDRWRDGPGRLVGAYGAHAAELVLRYGPDDPARQAPYFIGRGRYFEGRGWGEVLVFPYLSAPGRIVGFEFVGREGRPSDRVRRWIARPEAGLAGLETALEPHPEFGAVAFAVDDPALALRFQLRNAATSDRPLPIVAWYDDKAHRTEDAWFALSQRRIVFFGWELTAAMIRQAQACDGLISLSPMSSNDPQRIDSWFRDDPTQMLLRRVLKQARPWRDALRDWAEEHTPAQVEELLLAIEAGGDPRLEIAQIMGPAARELAEAPQRRVVVLSGTRVTETPSGWRMSPTGRIKSSRVVSEAILRVDQIVAGMEILYRGRILYKGREVPIEFHETHMQRLGQILSAACMRAGLGRPMILPAQPLSLIQVALSFHPPEYLAEAPAAGTDVPPGMTRKNGHIRLPTPPAASQGPS